MTQKVALVTGAARGIGLAAAKCFLKEGWKVALLDIQQDLLTKAVASLDAKDHTLALPCDVSDPQQVKAAFAQIDARFGRLDALVNNAGIAVFKSILDTTVEEWNRVLAVNLTGPFLCTQAAAPLMQRHGRGAIVNITSISGLRASTLRVAYGTSKAGLAHLTKQQATELGEIGIRVNAVAPGRLIRPWRKRYIALPFAPTITTPFPSIAMALRKSWPRRSIFSAPTRPAISPDRFWPLMEVSMVPG